MMLGREDRGIIASGWTTSKTYFDAHWIPERARRGEESRCADCEWEKILDPSIDSPVLVRVLQKQLRRFNFNWTPQSSGIQIPNSLAQELERIWARHLGQTALAAVDFDEELRAVEGEQRIAVVRHRRRERKLRTAKLKQALRAGNGKLRCEVPTCGFDFHEVYGELGLEYAQVHHLSPFADRAAPSETKLSDLAVVCANCHAMIHRGGKCRPLALLIRRQSA
jgi:predicted HNH restriction endonuclease